MAVRVGAMSFVMLSACHGSTSPFGNTMFEPSMSRPPCRVSGHVRTERKKESERVRKRERERERERERKRVSE
jgi:hypothetical protein